LQPRAASLHRRAHLGWCVRREIIEHDHIAWVERRCEDLFDIREERRVIDRSVKDGRPARPVKQRDDDSVGLTVTAQGVITEARAGGLRPLRRSRSVVTPHSSRKRYLRTSPSGWRCRQWRRAAATSGRCCSWGVVFYGHAEPINPPERAQRRTRKQGALQFHQFESGRALISATSRASSSADNAPAKLRLLPRLNRARLPSALD
jgi:hypothetical protein